MNKSEAPLTPSPGELLAELRARLTAAVDPEYRDGAVRFFKEPVDPYGVRSADLKKLISFASRAVKSWPAAARYRFCEQLWESGKMEEGVLAIYICRRDRKHFGAPEFRRFEEWIARYVRNWAHTDGLSSWLLSGCIENDPSLIARLSAWTRAKSRWKRRASIVALLQEAKSGRHTVEILGIAERLLDDTDDMVRKGLGWVLKEAYPKQPLAVVDWLYVRRSRASRLVLRIAAEKMTAQHRAAILG